MENPCLSFLRRVDVTDTAAAVRDGGFRLHGCDGAFYGIAEVRQLPDQSAREVLQGERVTPGAGRRCSGLRNILPTRCASHLRRMSTTQPNGVQSTEYVGGTGH